jgi:hypothetical protein
LSVQAEIGAVAFFDRRDTRQRDSRPDARTTILPRSTISAVGEKP